MKAAPDSVFAAMACLTGFGETLASSDTVKALVNRLAGDIIGAFPGLEKTLYSVVLLNVCLSVYEAGQVPVDNRKQILVLKQMTSWTDSPDEMASSLAAETCRGIHTIFPGVKSVYGPYWEQAVDYCLFLWKRAPRDEDDARLPYVYASLKLILALIGATDANEDLTDVLAERAEGISKHLIELLKIPPQKITQPSHIVDALLCRAVDNVPLEHVGDISDLFGLIASDSKNVQTAAFGLLHRALPAAQEKLSVDVLLGDKGETCSLVPCLFLGMVFADSCRRTSAR